MSNFVDQISLLEERLEDKLQTVASSLAKKKSDKVWDIISKLAIPATIAALGFAWNLNQRVLVIESTRITAAEFQKEIADIQKQIADIRSDIQRGPEWIKDPLVKLTASVNNMYDATAKISERIIKLEVQIEDLKKK